MSIFVRSEGLVSSEQVRGSLNSASAQKAGVDVINPSGEVTSALPGTDKPGAFLDPVLQLLEKPHLMQLKKEQGWTSRSRAPRTRYDDNKNPIPASKDPEWMKFTITLDKQESAEIISPEELEKIRQIAIDVFADEFRSDAGKAEKDDQYPLLFNASDDKEAHLRSRRAVIAYGVHTDTGNTHVHLWSQRISVDPEAKWFSTSQKLNDGPSYETYIIEKLSNALQKAGVSLGVTDAFKPNGDSMFKDRRGTPEGRATAGDAIEEAGGVVSENLKEGSPAAAKARVSEGPTEFTPSIQQMDRLMVRAERETKAAAEIYTAAQHAKAAMQAAEEAIARSEELRAQVETVTAEKDQYVETTEKLTDALSETNEKLEEVQTDLTAVSTQASQQATQLLQQEETISEQRTTLSAASETLVDAPIADIAEYGLDEGIQQVLDAWEEDRKQVAELQQQVAGLGAVVTEKTEALESTTAKLETVEAEATELKSEVKGLREQTTTDAGTIADLEASNQQYSQQIVDLSGQVTQYQTQVDTDAQTIVDVRKQVELLSNSNDRLVSDKDNMQEEIDRLSEQVSALIRTVTSAGEPQKGGKAVQTTMDIPGETGTPDRLKGIADDLAGGADDDAKPKSTKPTKGPKPK